MRVFRVGVPAGSVAVASSSAAQGRALGSSIAVQHFPGVWSNGFQAHCKYISSWKSSQAWEVQMTARAPVRVKCLLQILLCFTSIWGERGIQESPIADLHVRCG